ncbi:type II restriction endonuclease [Natrinema hispanicum]|uniref:EcoRII C terminal n=1 Tax=Natrinema hispanicum TaxID=392421 RepID=A0A1H9YNL3_9EURY|nr:type II restriction endonuclease [Natrinema hispanicum]SES70713.1 EcoRII C terminal [Natrinema hispanicum]
MNLDDIDVDALQNEIQGDGLLDEVREEHMPDSNTMSEEAINKWEDENYEITPDSVKENADHLLQSLLKREQDLYNHYQSQVYSQTLVYFLKNHYDVGQTALSSFDNDDDDDMEYADYATLQSLFTSLEEDYKSTDGFVSYFEKILPKIYPAMDAISVSAQQSRRKRAGSSLQSHLLNLFDRASFTVENVISAGNGHIYQIKKKNEPDDVGTVDVYISCLTTMRDRFRQSLSDSSAVLSKENQRRFIATASGTTLITASAADDVTIKKVREVTNEGFTLIVFEEVKNKQFPGIEGVISYKEFFSDQLPEILNIDR